MVDFPTPPFTLSEAIKQIDVEEAAQEATLRGYSNAEADVTPTASPMSIVNNTTYAIDVLVTGGTVTALEFSRDGAAFYDTGLTSGTTNLSPGDTLKVTYAVAPTITSIPR